MDDCRRDHPRAVRRLAGCVSGYLSFGVTFAALAARAAGSAWETGFGALRGLAGHRLDRPEPWTGASSPARGATARSPARRRVRAGGTWRRAAPRPGAWACAAARRSVGRARRAARRGGARTAATRRRGGHRGGPRRAAPLPPSAATVVPLPAARVRGDRRRSGADRVGAAGAPGRSLSLPCSARRARRPRRRRRWRRPNALTTTLAASPARATRRRRRRRPSTPPPSGGAQDAGLQPRARTTGSTIASARRCSATASR